MTLAAALFAVDPIGLGGVALRASAGSARDEWLTQLKNMLPLGTPMRRVPINISDTALLGGLDLGATLNAGRPVAQQGILAQADGGIVLLAMAERLPTETAARLAAVLDMREVAIERDGVALRRPARVGLVALDEGFSDDEQVPAALLDRLAFHVQLQEFQAQSQPQLNERAESSKASQSVNAWAWQPDDITSARALLPLVQASSEVVQALCAAALALGVYSLRAPLLALRTARAAAALDGQTCVTEEHVSLAARLVLGPRATQLPPSSPKDEADANEADTLENQDDQSDEQAKLPPEPSQNDLSGTPPADALLGQPDTPLDDNPDTLKNAGDVLAETVLEATQAAIPPGLLTALKIGRGAKSRAQAIGRSGAAKKSQTRGRPLGARRGEPRAGARLNVIETLRAAAPWQKLREHQYERQHTTPEGLKRQRMHVRREDFHVTRFKQLSQTTTLFVVDASGSSALNRLAEAKGAVELLLADCYVRRDHVAVLAFRGKTAELLLPPTRSLARAKRSLAGLPGGGGTPLATALDAARVMADQISRKGETPIVVLLTDGRGNIARDGSPGRARADIDAMAAARQLRLAGITALLLDTSPTPQAAAQALASEMGAGYVPLPYAGAQVLSQAVRMATANATVLAN